MLFYRATAVVVKNPTFVAGIISRHRISIGSLWGEAERPAAGTAGLGLPAQGETFAELAAGFGSVPHGLAVRERGCDTARGPGTEATQCAQDAKKAVHAFVVLDAGHDLMFPRAQRVARHSEHLGEYASFDGQ